MDIPINKFKQFYLPVYTERNVYTLKDMANYNSPIRHSDFPTQYLPEHILEDFQLGTMLECSFYVDLGWHYEDSLKELCWIFSEIVVSVSRNSKTRKSTD